MVEIQTVVENEAGIHCRPSSEILMKRQEFPDCQITVSTDKGETSLDSILSLLGLGLGKGDKVIIRAEGKNEEEVCKILADLFAYHFDFPQENN